MPPQHRPASRTHTDGHEGAVPRRIGLTDRDELDAADEQPDGLLDQRGLVRHGQDDGVGALFQITGAGFTRGVDKLRGKNTRRQVGSNQDVVDDQIGIGLAPNVNGSLRA